MAHLRPREQARLAGVDALRDEELLALLIGSGSRGEQAVDAGRRLMDKFGGDLHALGRSGLLRLEAVRGIGPARAVCIAAAMELGRRRMARPDPPVVRVTRSEDIVRRFRSRLIDRSEEEFWALALNRANGALADLRISIGGQSGTVVDPKVVFSKALVVRASALVLVHNHPSGNPRPSESDKRLTRSLVEAGRALDLPVLDHVIIAGMRHFSFADHQLL
ncbi:MAG: DNA repair protein RadC [Bacteroidota bacterium]|nr:DNA repair protein RadC [Bacteroidota bacterium]